MFKFFSLNHIAAGFVAVMVGFTSSAALVFQAASIMDGATPAEVSSWVFALGLGISFTCILLSLLYKTPVLTGWSTTGAAVLVTSLSGVPMSEATGAFMLCGLLTLLAGATGFFEKIMDHIPKALTSAMLAGILFPFGMRVFSSMQSQSELVFFMLLIYLVGKRYFPRYVIVMVLLFGVLYAQNKGLIHYSPIHFTLPSPVFTFPHFSLQSFMSITIPLFVVTMTSQNLPGIVMLNTNGYRPPFSPLIFWTGLVTFLLSPFGSYSVCLAAITGGICAGKEADDNPANRYKSTLMAGFFWFLIALFGASVVAVFFAFPKELVLALAGLALFSTIGNSLKIALDDEKHRDPAIITILVSASNVSLFGIGSAFWGLAAGILATLLLTGGKEKRLATA